MGNATSRGSRKFLDDSVNWQEYYGAEWRSERSRELDRHGGPGRPPVARGDSVTAKLVFLEGALRHDQRRMKQVLQVLDDEAQRREQQVQRREQQAQERLPDFILNTDFRAYERTQTPGEQEEPEGAAQQQQQKDFSLVAKDPHLRKKMMEQRRKMLEYAKRVNVTKGAPGIKPLNLPAIKSKVASSWKPEEHVGHGEEEDGGGEAGSWSSPQPAEWRLRMHQARRRLILLVGAVARWQLALSRRPGPKRLPRINSFSYFIPQVLGVEAKRFIEEANAIAKITADAIRVEEPAAEAALERIPPADLPPPRHYQQHQLGPELAETPERLRRDRGPPRRGVSDSGFPGAAAAAAAAVAAADAEAAAGADGASGGGAGLLGAAAARPKRRPELRKSASGKCSSTSLPDSLMPGHTSDMETYAPPRRLYSSRVPSTRLPALTGGGGRVSTSGILAALVPHGPHGEVPSPPMVARQPRAKLSRISSSAHTGRTSRRQSDSSLAMVVAAAAAAVPPAATPAERRTAAPAAATAARGAGWRSRGSDCGSMRRQRDGSEAGGSLGGIRQSVSGAAPPAVLAVLASPRRSETGQQVVLTSAGSAPPDSPSAGGGGGGPAGAFLPRISSSSGVGVGIGGGGGGGPASSPSSASKSMTLGQARRLALLAEAGSLTGNVPAAADEGAVSRGSNPSTATAASSSSPSRLGPLKLGVNGSVGGATGASRSPDKAGGVGGVGGILGALRQSRDGSPSVASLGALPLAAGGMRELREVMAAANGGGTGAGPGVGGPLSPLNSPGMRARTISMDAALLGPIPASTSGRTGLTSSSSSPARHSASSLGPPPASGAASPSLAPLPHLHLNAPAASAPGADTPLDESEPPPVSPTAAPLPLAAPSPPRRPSTASTAPASSAPPPTATLAPAAISAPASITASSALSSTTSSTTSSSSAATANTSNNSSGGTTISSTSATSASASSAPAPAPSLPPLPNSKPPLGPAGTVERVRSGRTTNSAASSNPPSPAPAPSQPPPPPVVSASAPASAASSAGGAPLPPPPSAAAAAPPPPPPPLDAEAAARLAKAQQLMGMYANRVNATWAESQQWGAPTVLSVPEQELFCASDAWVPYKVTVIRMLKAGSLGVHIDACADAVQMPDGTSMDVWTSDPWVLAQKLRPGSLPLSERIEGVSLGARALQQLVLAVEALAGREAVPKLTVVLAINDDQRNAVVADIIRTRSYGLKPENLVLTAQRKRCGYRYDRDAQAFLEDPSTPAQVLGSGFSLCQLAWLGDAFSVTREGELSMLMGRTLLERFSECRVEWLVARRARDLALLTPEGVLDLQHLAFSLYAADRHSGNMVVQTAPASNLTIPRAYDSTLLVLRNPPASAGGGSSRGGAAATTRIATVAASAAGVEGGGGAAGVVDLRAAELSSPLMVEALAAVRKQAGHDGWVGLQRYLLHVPTLHAMLNTLGIFRAKLTMCGDVSRLSLDAADITADRRVACVAVHTRTSPAILTSPNEVDDLIPLLLAQDHSAAFRDIISASNEAANDTAGGAGGDASGRAASSGGGRGVSAGGGGGGPSPSIVTLLASKPGIRILLFIAANDVTQLAVNLVLLMARPGRDVVHLVTVVHNSLQMPTGQALLLKYLKQISNAMIEAHSEVLVKGSSGLLEVMEGSACRLAPQLVVMASAALTMTNLNTASVMGSVTLSVLKRLSLPVAVATSNSKNLVLTQRRTALRCMMLVEPTSRPALNFMCSSCMEPMRGDKLVLAGHHPTRQMTTQQQQAQRRLTDNFGDVASSHRFHTPTKLQLDGPVDKALITAAEDEAVHLVALQVPLGTKSMPGHVLGLIRACKGGVLVFRDTA